MKAVTPSIVVYMAKVEGRYAVDAWNIPALETVTIRKMMAILGFIVREITAKRRVSHTEQRRAKTMRIK
jgi:hypothetical protein